MVVTNKIGNVRSVYKDAKTVVDAMSKGGDEWQREYWDVVSQYNGSRRKLDDRIMVSARMRGLNELDVRADLDVARTLFERRQDEEVGENKENYNQTGYVPNEEAGFMAALEERTGGTGLMFMKGYEPKKEEAPEGFSISDGLGEGVSNIFGEWADREGD